MKKDTVDYKKVEELGYRRATRLRKIEHALVNYPDGINWEKLCSIIGLNTASKARTLQNDLNELRALYCGKQFISSSPHRLELNGGDLAFPEAEFSAKDRKQLSAICRLIAFFDGAVPIKDVLNVTVRDAEEALKGISDNIDISTNGKEIAYIKEIFEAIEGRYVLDVIFPRLNNGKEFPFAPYMLKRFNNKWFVIGRMYVDNPFDWTVIPLAGIPILNKHKGDCTYLPKKEFEIREIKKRIKTYYDKVLGFYVPTNENDSDKVPRSLNPDTLQTEDIIINCTPKALRLIKENPIHINQRISEKDSEVRLNLVINPLLIKRILGFGDEVEVISPKILREDVKNTIQKMSLRYQTNKTFASYN